MQTSLGSLQGQGTKLGEELLGVEVVMEHRGEEDIIRVVVLIVKTHNIKSVSVRNHLSLVGGVVILMAKEPPIRHVDLNAVYVQMHICHTAAL